MLVHARLNVDLDDIQSECLFRGRRCYGYFGLTPSLVRMPFLGVLWYFHSALTPLFLGVAVLLGYWAALQFLQRLLRQCADPAGSRPRRCSVTRSSAHSRSAPARASCSSRDRPSMKKRSPGASHPSSLRSIRWPGTHGRSEFHPGGVAGIAAANARPTMAAACGILGIVVAALSYPADGARAHMLRHCASACCPVSPRQACLTLKVRTPVPNHRLSQQMTRAPHWRTILSGKRATERPAWCSRPPSFVYFVPTR